MPRANRPCQKPKALMSASDQMLWVTFGDASGQVRSDPKADLTPKP